MTIESILAQYHDPYLEMDLVSAKAIKKIEVNGSKASIHLVFHYPIAGIRTKITQELTQLLKDKGGFTDVAIQIDSNILAHSIQQGLKSHAQIKNIIAVGSGKGGVGKSTTAVNLALALAAEGAKTGILDADIYGPSQPVMLGTSERPTSNEDGKIIPITRYGLQSMSIGYLIDSDNAVAWRGPMVSGALQQLISDTQWDALDYLIIDLPPGTGDIHLTLAQKIPVSAAIIVTTPQDIALADARRAITLFRKVSVPVLGVVENMSIHICSQCGHQEAIFGSQGGAKMATEVQVPLLGQLPLDIRIREQSDKGEPVVAQDPNGVLAGYYREIARKSAARLSLQARDYSKRFPKVVVADT